MVSKFAILVAIIAFIMIVSTVIQFSRKKITLAWSLFWCSLWIVGTAAVWFAGILDIIGEYLIGDSGRFLAIYLAIVVLFYLFYRLFLTIQRMDQSMSKLVEELAKRK
jgi:hypothetical protein